MSSLNLHLLAYFWEVRENNEPQYRQSYREAPYRPSKSSHKEFDQSNLGPWSYLLCQVASIHKKTILKFHISQSLI